MTEPIAPTRAAVALFGRAATVLAAASAVFLFLNYAQGDGFCNPDKTAANAAVMALAVAVLGLTAVLPTVLRKKYRGARAAALLGWTASLVPAVLLLGLVKGYVASIHPGCPM